MIEVLKFEQLKKRLLIDDYIIDKDNNVIKIKVLKSDTLEELKDINPNKKTLDAFLKTVTIQEHGREFDCLVGIL